MTDTETPKPPLSDEELVDLVNEGASRDEIPEGARWDDLPAGATWDGASSDA